MQISGEPAHEKIARLEREVYRLNDACAVLAKQVHDLEQARLDPVPPTSWDGPCDMPFAERAETIGRLRTAACSVSVQSELLDVERMNLALTARDRVIHLIAKQIQEKVTHEKFSTVYTYSLVCEVHDAD